MVAALQLTHSSRNRLTKLSSNLANGWGQYVKPKTVDETGRVCSNVDIEASRAVGSAQYVRELRQPVRTLIRVALK